MKEKSRFLGIIAIIAIIGFTFAACDDDTTIGTTDLCANGHDGLTVPKAATCAEAGNSDKHGTCTRCGQTISGTLIPAIGHHAPNGTYPTCIADGNTGIGFCQRQGCGEYVTGATIPALGHAGLSAPKAATCTEAGNSENYGTCTRCETTIGTTIPAFGHDGLSAPKATTCTEAGNSEKYGKCTRCEQSITGTVIPAPGHHAPNGTYPTCIADGNTGTGFCQRQGCGEYVTGATIPALGHAGLSAPKAATCTAAGNSEKYGTCTLCEQSITGTVIPALEHHAPDGKYPTCTEVGNTGTGICQRQGCGAFIAGTMIPALRPGFGHDHTSSLICKIEGCYHRYAIGDEGPAGGIIFYVAPSGFTITGYGSPGDTDYFAGYKAYYLEAAPEEQRLMAWASSGFEHANITGTGTAIGTGRENTRLILATDANAPAAKACADYRGGDKNDWFLPSKDELYEMYKEQSLLKMYKDYSFWSSSQDINSGSVAWLHTFNNLEPHLGMKGTYFSIRYVPVRAF